MKLRFSELLPWLPVIDLVSDLAPFRADLAAYFLPALVRDMSARTLYLCVVDPGVGGERSALAVEADGDWYVGPDNGLLALVARRASKVRVLRVDWRPEVLSPSFHGRDLFAPVAAILCDGRVPRCTEIDRDALIGNDWPHELAKVIFMQIDTATWSLEYEPLILIRIRGCRSANGRSPMCAPSARYLRGRHSGTRTPSASWSWRSIREMRAVSLVSALEIGSS